MRILIKFNISIKKKRTNVMYYMGIDMGTSTVKIVLVKDKVITGRYIARHYGKILACVAKGIREICSTNGIGDEEQINVTVTGSNSHLLTQVCPESGLLDDIPAIVDGIKSLVPEARTIIEIGSQGARYITDIDSVPQFSVNEHCAGGTGSFFEDQMSRLGLDIEDYSRLVVQAREIPRLSGRCAVFAKTDIIHRQQEGVPKQDILLGLCYAMIKNFKAAIVKTLPVNKPVVFCGGVTENVGVIRALKDVFGLSDEELIIPEDRRFEAAYGAALKGCEKKTQAVKPAYLLELIENSKTALDRTSELPRLMIPADLELKDPQITGIIPDDGCYIGIDVGSTSTDIVLMGDDKTIIDFLYLRTAGDPEGVVRSGLKTLYEHYGEFKVKGVGITGSGRERLGRMMGADAIRDEITAQAKAAVMYVPDADTVFEIGGQDSKYISLKNGEVADFTMNKICAAGTGSFVEEQSLRMGIPIEQFGHLAIAGEHPCDLGERCTVFIETAIASAEGEGASKEDIAAGLCHSIVKNYLHKVVGNKPVGKSIVLQGGVDYNPGIVAAFMSAYKENIKVSPIFSISGAVGAAYLAKEAMEAAGISESTFLGFDFPKDERSDAVSSEQIRANKAFYKKAGQFAVEGYDAAIDPAKKTIGVPLSLIMFKFFLLAYEFFKNLGYNVVLSDTTNETTIADSQAAARGETCYPVKLLYGHMKNLADKKVDYIFMPLVHTIRHPHAHAVHNYACPYMQTAAKSIYDSLGLKEQGIELLSPVFDLDLGAKNMAMAMLDVGRSLGFSKPRCMVGMLKGAAAVNRYSENCERIGKEVLDNLKPDEKVPVIITRNYGISDPVLNMGVPEILLSKGYKVLTLGHLPGMSLDISKDYPNMYWPFGDHLLSGAKLIRNHPNLYAVYLTNHGCGPDSVINHMFAEEMGDKPYLHLEVDEHFSKVGVITRIEAFLNSISHQPDAVKEKDFDICNVRYNPANIEYKADKRKTLIIPDIGYYSDCLSLYYDSHGIKTAPAPRFNREVLNTGRARMNGKEYLPLPMLLGSIMQMLDNTSVKEAESEYLVPYNYGSDADGQYARVIRTILDETGHKDITIIAPILEEVIDKADDIELLFKCLLLGDIVYSVPAGRREEFAKSYIKADTLDKLTEAAHKAVAYRNSENAVKADESSLSGESLNKKVRLVAVGSALSITSLDEGILNKLECEGYDVSRVPLSEMLLFMWLDNNKGNAEVISRLKALMSGVDKALEGAGTFSKNFDELFNIAEDNLKGFQGADGRYRYSKTIQVSVGFSAVLELAPRYENTAMVLEMRGFMAKALCPVYNLSLDGDWDENSENRLNSFLYYC